MVRSHQNLSGSHDLTTPLSGGIFIPGRALFTINLSTKFKVAIYINYEDSNIDAKCGNGVVWGS